MISTPIQEFNSIFEAELSPNLGAVAVWESPRLTTMFPAIDAPSGSDRAVCHTVNGILRMRLLSSFNDYAQDCELYAGLWGEYAGVTGSIQTNTYNEIKKYADYSIEFDLFNNRANLCQNIYIRLAFMRVRTVLSPDPVPPTRGYIKAVMSGVLLGGDIRI